MSVEKNKLTIIVGGPGGSGSSTISSMLAEHFNVTRVYAGSIYREYAQKEGYKSFEKFLSDVSSRGNDVDKEVDEKLRDIAKSGNVVIESKVFGAIASKENIPCTVKIWLDADVYSRARRHIQRDKGRIGLLDGFRMWNEVKKLQKRYEIDKEKYARLYGIEYDKPAKYNDIVLETSEMDEKQTFELILERIKDGGYIKEGK
jgi:cytidylate kinase